VKTSTIVQPFVRPRLLLLLLAGLPAYHSAFAQSSGPAIRGEIRSSAGAPIDYATVTLHRAADSTVVKAEFSDEKGIFQFEQAAGGRYLVSASQVGFVRAWSQPFEQTASGTALPALTLQTNAATQLKEVQVVGQ
jgi:hypothetical protein